MTSNQNKTPHKHAELIKLWADGAIIEYYSESCSRWIEVAVNSPTWSSNLEYRVKPEIAHKVGNVYSYNGSTYILARVSKKEICLVSLQNGNRYIDAVLYEGPNCTVDSASFKKVSLGRDFNLIKD
jgi:hypothetical protein